MTAEEKAYFREMAKILENPEGSPQEYSEGIYRLVRSFEEQPARYRRKKANALS